MTPNGYTFIKTIAADCVPALRHYLKHHVDPEHLRSTDATLHCRRDFRFDKINRLQNCSFCIIDADAPYSATLVFEATFDGPLDEFIEDLLQTAPDTIDKIFSHCEGYPRSGMKVPVLVREYFLQADVRSQLLFRGSPGRDAAQIKNESDLRAAVVRYLSERRSDRTLPQTGAGMQHDVRLNLVEQTPGLRWAMQPARLAWEVVWRDWNVYGVYLVLAAAAGVLGWLVLLLTGHSPGLLAKGVKPLMTWFQDTAGAVQTSLWPRLGPVPLPDFEIPIVIVTLILLWFALRIVEFCLEALTEDPRDYFFIRRIPLHLVYIARYAVFCVLIAFAAQYVLQWAANAEGVPAINNITEMLEKRGRDRAALNQWFAFPHVVSGRVMLFIGLLVLWITLRYLTKSLQLSAQFQRLSLSEENVRSLAVDLLRFARVAVVSLAFLVFAGAYPLNINASFWHALLQITYGVVGATTYVFTGLMVAYAAAIVLCFIPIRLRELADRRRYRDAADLIPSLHGRSPVYAREDCGTNRHQNSLISVTHVKPGLFRYVLLRLALFTINLFGRIWYNVGDLAGIPTILSARFVLIDGGKRLLFLDHYSGAWESYLNEFIDMGAVKGLNAVWSNTFVKAGVERKSYGYPETRFFFWQGAQAERPFKAYVRHSQVETLVWYSAFPTLSIRNINMNTRVRQSLMGHPGPGDPDDPFRYL